MIDKLDLHGMRHSDVERVVENFVLLNEPPLIIITGNSDYMRNAVKIVCKNHSIEYEMWNWGEIKILK